MKTLMMALELMAVSMTVADPPPITPDPPPIQQNYAAFVSRVERGESLLLSVGVDRPNAIRCDDARKFGISDGLYSCWFDGGEAKMRTLETGVQNVGTITATPAYNPVTRYYLPVWNQSCPDGKCQPR